jgi:hypothetical protein
MEESSEVEPVEKSASKDRTNILGRRKCQFLGLERLILLLPSA